jgi:hypothetical protein
MTVRQRLSDRNQKLSALLGRSYLRIVYPQIEQHLNSRLNAADPQLSGVQDHLAEFLTAFRSDLFNDDSLSWALDVQVCSEKMEKKEVKAPCTFGLFVKLSL